VTPEREHQLAAQHATRANLDRRRTPLTRKFTIDQPDEAQRPRDRADHRQSRERCQPRDGSPRPDS